MSQVDPPSVVADFFGGGGVGDVSDSGISGKEVACELMACPVVSLRS